LDFYGEEGFSELSEETKERCWIKTEDFEIALKKIQPTAKREGFSVIPGTTWEDIGALQLLREELETSICWPIKNPETYDLKFIAESSKSPLDLKHIIPIHQQEYCYMDHQVVVRLYWPRLWQMKVVPISFQLKVLNF